MELDLHTKKVLENLAKSFEKDFSKVVELFEYAREKIAEETGKKEPKLSIAAIHVTRAKLTELQQETGKEINIIIFGKDPSRDSNASLRKQILADFWNNPESRRKVVEQGKVMVMKAGKGDPTKDFHSVYKPVTKIIESVEVDGETVVTKGEIWDPALVIDPICRDFRKFLDDDENVENWNYTKPLLENWRTTYFGIGYFEDTPDLTKKVQLRFFGDSADPHSGQFVGKRIDFFIPYKVKVTVNENLSTEDCYSVSAKNVPVPSGDVDIDIIAMLEAINTMHRARLEAKGKKPLDLIPIVDMADLKKWHLERRARKDVDGNIMKSDSGWDLTNWDEYCVIDQVTYLGLREFSEGYKPAVLQHDSTGRRSFFVNYDNDINMNVPVPADILICVKTGRGLSSYDRESRTKVELSDDPDLSINICGLKTLESYEKIIFPKEVTGDL